MSLNNCTPIVHPADTTALAVARMADLTGRLAVVTGGSVGLGLETTRALASAGAEVFIGARRPEVLAASVARLKGEGAKIHARPLDLMSVKDVDAFANAVLALDRPVDIFVANAGIMACPLHRTPGGVESQFMTNVVGHAVLLSRLVPALLRSNDARFVSLSSSGHQLSPIRFTDVQFEQTPYDKWVAYGQSKTGCALLAVQAAQSLGPLGVSAFAVHPGLIMTELARALTPRDRDAIQQVAGGEAGAAAGRFKDASRGAATSVWAATDPGLKGRGPLYLEDLHVAERVTHPNMTHGVMDHALDPASAQRLWQVIEAVVGRPLPLADHRAVAEKRAR